MSRALLALLLLCGLTLSAWGEEKEEQEPNPGKTPTEQVQADPNDLAAWKAYWTENLNMIFNLMDSDPTAALKQVEVVEATLEKYPPTSEEAITSTKRIKGSLTSLKASLAIAQMPLEEVEKQLFASPDDAKAITNYQRKITQEMAKALRADTAQAEEQLKAVREKLAKAKEAAQEVASKSNIEKIITSLKRYDDAIASSRKMEDLIGKDAAPLVVDTWVNGTPLTDADLKGKVVILDFWAVWCGPCIATFPHLREWQDKYGDKGLVIIGMTRHYNFKWDEEVKKAAKAEEDVSPEDENEMLVKFAESHNLKHRFAIQEKKDMSDYYVVGGIPHVVVIDQQGKIQMMKVGSGDENAKAIDDLLKKLLSDEKPTGK